jgi:hypothetical protein
MWRDLRRGIRLAVVVRRVDGRAALALVAGALELPADFLLLVCGCVAARKDRGHSAGSGWADSEAPNANRIQDDTAVAEIEDPKRTIARGSAKFVP